jgi:hypothetical protein
MFLRERNAADIQSPLEIPFPTNWLESLSNLLKGMKKSEFQTVDALCAACAQDDIAAGMMLKRILHWHGSLQREFYLSNQDWWQQCRVQRRTIDRVKAQIFPLCGVLFETKFNPMAHANVTHYRLHEWKFMSRLSDVLGMPALYLFYRLCPKRAERYVRNEQNVMSKTDTTLTRESTIKTSTERVNDSVVSSPKIVEFKSTGQMQVIELLKGAGVRSAAAYASLPADVVQACIASANEPGVRNRVGYLVGALKKQLQAHYQNPADTAAPPPNPLPIADEIDSAGEQTGRAESSSAAAQTAQEKWTDVLARLRDSRVSESEPEAVSEKLLVLVAGQMTAHAAWSAAYHQLELQLDRASFDTWLRSAKLLDYEPAQAPSLSTFVVEVHNAHAQGMLQHRLYRNVARILRDVTGVEVGIRFEVKKPNTADGQGLKRFLKTNQEGDI